MLVILDQKDRHTGVDAFRRDEKDVLVATDVASKGLDFENIQHVINFDMPEDIENYGIFLLQIFSPSFDVYFLENAISDSLPAYFFIF